jgi:hypothetical protein
MTGQIPQKDNREIDQQQQGSMNLRHCTGNQRIQSVNKSNDNKGYHVQSIVDDICTRTL